MVLNFKYMETVLERVCEVLDEPRKKSHLGTTILMILFFLMFGAASLYVLINSPA